MTELKIKRGEEMLWQNMLKRKADMSAVDLTGYTASSQMRTYPAGNLVAEGECTIDTETGTVLTLYTSEVTERIGAGRYGFDVWLNHGGQKVCIDTVGVTVCERYTEEE